MFHFSLRKKLLLVSLLILLVPWVGVRYIQAIENYLQQSLLDNLSHYTQSVASGLAQQAELIPTFPAGEAVFALPLQKKPQLDGYDNDWDDYVAYRTPFKAELPIAETKNTGVPSLLTGLFDNSLYLHITIPDRQIVYLGQNNNLATKSNDLKTVSGDSIQLILNSTEQHRDLIIQTEAPGTITARDTKNGRWESRIKGIWRERDNDAGFQLELKLPLSYVSEGFNVVVNNVGAGQTTTYQFAQSSYIPVLSSPQELTNLFGEFGMIPGRRIWLLDDEGRVLVKSGSLIIEGKLSPVNPLFAWLLAPQLIADPWKGKTRLERDDIQTALMGISDSRRLAGTNGENIILSSAWPVKRNQQTVAVLLIEESTAAIQIMQRSALSELLNLSLLVFLLLSVALIGFAGRLATRIRRLRDITDQSIDKHGRVNGDIPDNKQGDELDELASHINDMLHRLRQYHDYLEKLASRLSHELRTPIAVVRSSLENMHLTDLSKENIEILNRADTGIMRLQTILNRMGEASRLEQSIDDSKLEDFALDEFLENMTAGYRGVYPEQSFELFLKAGRMTASKDLIAQCLDKLVSNAVSFVEPDSTIIISTEILNNYWQISVYNQGPPLPVGMEEQLFQSMVSVREKKSKNEEPHLGLGLHIVRLIAEFHQGEVSARNQNDGVCFILKIPNG